MGGVGKVVSSSGGKQRSLDTVRKIVKTKQSNLVKEMMFGVVVRKGGKLRENDVKETSATETKVDAKTIENRQSDAPVASLKETAVVDIEEGTVPNSNRSSLSLLSCDYGSSSSNSSDNE